MHSIAGHETTTLALAFTLWELSRHAGAQDRLRAELRAFCGEPSYDDFQTRLPFLDAVLKETCVFLPFSSFLSFSLHFSFLSFLLLLSPCLAREDTC